MKKISLILLLAFCLLFCSCEKKKQAEKAAPAADEPAFTTESTTEKAGEKAPPTENKPASAAESTTEKSGEKEAVGQKEQPEEFRINEDILSELGMSYEQLCEKYGETPEIYFNTCFFKNGHGLYSWKSYDGEIFDDPADAGGCNCIDAVSPREMFGLGASVSFDELTERGYVMISAEKEEGLDDSYWAEFSYPPYKDVSFVFSTKEYGTVEADKTITVVLNKDCKDAAPIALG